MDDFYMNPDDLNDDAQLSIVDEEKLKVLDKIEEYVKLTKEAVKFQETDEYATNFRVLSRYVSAMVDLNNLDNNEIEVENDDGTIATKKLSDEEVLEKIKEIEMSVEDVSHQMLRDVTPDDEDNTRLSLDDIACNNKNQDDDGSLDF